MADFVIQICDSAHVVNSTHAKTIEFRLTVKSNIDSAYESVARAWEKGRGENFKVVSK